jgi:hypothetical protein
VRGARERWLSEVVERLECHLYAFQSFSRESGRVSVALLTSIVTAPTTRRRFLLTRTTDRHRGRGKQWGLRVEVVGRAELGKDAVEG